MPKLFLQLTQDIRLTGRIQVDATKFLAQHGNTQTAGHSAQVAAEARRLAQRFGVAEAQAETAGWLHDISAVIPNQERPGLARAWGLEVLPEEEAAPMIIHQKLSAVMAHEIFGVVDEAVLSAIGCHTTLKANGSRLDKVVFVADKIRWDQAGKPPYLADILAALERSLDEAAFCYLDYLWRRRERLAVVHPWFVEAYWQLAEIGREL
jgi:predicted HD superfamily hydrolase involved in NAD metabolism